MIARSATALVCGLVLAIAGTIGAYAWDAAKADEIAAGIRVGDVDLGGLDEDEARKRLRHALVEPLDEPVRVSYRGEDFTLHADDLAVRADIDGMVAEALAATRDGGLPLRLARYATGGEVNHGIEPEVAYSETAVERFVQGVAAAINAAARDASVRPIGARLETFRGVDGRALREEALRAQIRGAIETRGDGDRMVKAPVDVVEPDVSVADLRSQHPTYVVVDRDSFTLRLYRNLELEKEYTVAIGQVGYDTPTGEYSIQSKQVDPTWYVPDSEWAGDLAGTTVPPGPDNPLKARWMGFDGGAGIHGTADAGSLGSAASHGCVRMAVPDVVDLYDQVGVGTPVYVE